MLSINSPRWRVRMVAAFGAAAVAVIPVFLAAAISDLPGDKPPPRLTLALVGILAAALSGGWIGWRLIDPKGRHARDTALPLAVAVWLLAYYLFAVLLSVLIVLENPTALSQLTFWDALGTILISGPSYGMAYGLLFSSWYTLPVALVGGYMASRRYRGQGAGAGEGERRIVDIFRLDADTPRRKVRWVAAAWVAAVAAIPAYIAAGEGVHAVSYLSNNRPVMALAAIFAAAVIGYWIGWILINPQAAHDWGNALLVSAFIWFLSYYLLAVLLAVPMAWDDVLAHWPPGFGEALITTFLAVPAVVFFMYPAFGLYFGFLLTGWYTLPVALIAGYFLSRLYRSHAADDDRAASVSEGA